jgi:hypothetical protein
MKWNDPKHIIILHSWLKTVSLLWLIIIPIEIARINPLHLTNQPGNFNGSSDMGISSLVDDPRHEGYY